MNALTRNGGGGKPPAIRKPVKPAHFYKFVRDADYLVEWLDQLLEARRELLSNNVSGFGYIESLDSPEMIECLDDCRESMRRYDRDGDNDPRYDEDGDLTIEHVSDRLAKMIAAWTGKPKFETPEQAERWGLIMVERVMAQEPTAVELESACQKLNDEGKPFCPETPELIKALKAEQEAWKPRKRAIGNAKRVLDELLEEISKAKARAEKRKAEEEVIEARWRAKNEAAIARKKIQDEIEAACRQVEAEEADWKAEEGWIAKCRNNGRSFAREHVALQGLFKMIRNSLPEIDDEAHVSIAIGVFEARREMRAWQRDAERELEQEAEFFRELERRAEEQIAKAYTEGRNYKFPPVAAALEKQLGHGRWLYLVFPFTVSVLPGQTPSELLELGVTVAEQCLVAFALGLFKTRRRARAWEYAIEADAPAPALTPAHRPSSKRRRRRAEPPKLAAARVRVPTKKSKPKGGAE
jgi:hypothetical protein